MCNRICLSRDIDEIGRHFSIAGGKIPLKPHWNIAANLRMPAGADLALIKRFSGLRGLVEVDDVAAMIAHLASDAGRAFHGACVTMDRGITAG